MWINYKNWTKSQGTSGWICPCLLNVFTWKNVSDICSVTKLKQYNGCSVHGHLITQVSNFKKVCIEESLYNMTVFTYVLSTYKITLRSIIHLC